MITILSTSVNCSFFLCNSDFIADDNRQDEENTIRVVYELPVTWEEVSSCRNILFAIIDISDNIASNVLDTVNTFCYLIHSSYCT
jgi:hypothetical protein